MRPHGFSSRLRLKQRRDFLRVQRGGAKHHLRHFLVFVSRRRSPPGHPDHPDASHDEAPLPTRLGITVTRKVGNAVARNQIKRLVREVFRHHREQLPAGLDVVWVAKQQAAGVSFAEVLADFQALAQRDLTSGRSRSKARRRQ